jgi:hypothetical protein
MILKLQIKCSLMTMSMRDINSTIWIFNWITKKHFNESHRYFFFQVQSAHSSFKLQKSKSMVQCTVKRTYDQCCGSGSGFGSGSDRIRTFLVGSGSWPYKMTLYQLFGVCKSPKYFSSLCCRTFWFMDILFWGIFWPKKFSEKTWPKIYLGQDPDPDPDVL